MILDYGYERQKPLRGEGARNDRRQRTAFRPVREADPYAGNTQGHREEPPMVMGLNTGQHTR